jgi:hypothetical protein
MVHSRRVIAAPGTSLGFQVAGEAFDIGAAAMEQAEVVLAQIKGVGLAGQSGVARQEPSEAEPLLGGEDRLSDDDRSAIPSRRALPRLATVDMQPRNER